ncbi:hypothetical protein ACT43C_16515 [Acinetobacter baumannii]
MTAIFGIISPHTIQKEFDNFPAGRTTGVSIAAIKCLLGLGLTINFYSKSCATTITELEKLTGLSRPMVVKGLQHLQDYELIEKDVLVRNKATVYKLIFWEDKKFSKTPKKWLLSYLSLFPNRGIEALTALKLYLVLLVTRPNHLKEVEISYNGLNRYHINPKHLKKAIDLLIVSSLISVARELNIRGDGSYYLNSNKYTILGLKLN